MLSTVEDALLSRSHDNNRTAEYHTPHLMEDLDKNLSTHLTSPERTTYRYTALYGTEKMKAKEIPKT